MDDRENTVEDIEIEDDKNILNQEPADKEKSVFRELLGLLFYLVVVLVITYLVVTFVGQRTEVNGMSMFPTLADGDNLIVEKLSYRVNEPERFDIIVFPYPGDEAIHYIKRVIGLPGETIQIIDGDIYIDHVILEEDYGYETIANPGIASEPIVLGEDEYFVLGDNRNNSQDSRYAVVGNIKQEDIVGRAWLRIWPLKTFGILEHRTSVGNGG